MCVDFCGVLKILKTFFELELEKISAYRLDYLPLNDMMMKLTTVKMHGFPQGCLLKKINEGLKFENVIHASSKIYNFPFTMYSRAFSATT